MAKGRAALIRPSATPSTARQVPDLRFDPPLSGWQAGSVRAVTQGIHLSLRQVVCDCSGTRTRQP